MSNVLTLGDKKTIPVPPRPDPDVVALLEGYLQAAKAGEVVAVFIACISSEGSCGHAAAVTGTSNAVMLLGAAHVGASEIATRVARTAEPTR
jgi:hypothetical protein